MRLVRRRIPALLAASTFAAVAAPSAAQQLPDKLTLEDALRLARAGNPIFRKTENDLELASNGIRAAWAAFLPTLNPSINFSGGRSRTLTGQDDYGSPIQLPEARDYRSSSTGQSLNIGSITLFDGGANIRTVRERRANYAMVDAQIAQQQIELDARVSREFYLAIRAIRNIALEESLLASSQERLTRTEELLRLAARNRVDVLGARSDVKQGQQNVERARGEADRARLTLAATLGLPAPAPLQLDTVLPPVFDPANLDVDWLVAQALRTSPAVRRAEHAVSAANQRAAAARGARWPRLNAGVSYSRGMQLSSYEAFKQFNPQNWSFGFNYSLTLPLFTRFQISNQIAAEEAAARDADYDLRATRLALEKDIRTSIIDLNNAYRSLQLALERAELSRERQQLAQEQYRLSGISFIELQNLFDRTAEAERQALDARFTFISARLALEEKLGARLEN
jgi:outer membrane protein TolC